MKIENTSIEGLKVIHLNRFTDNRGDFLKIYNSDFFIENNLRTDFKENYFSISNKDVIRGMHFQLPPYEHVKLIYLNKGNILDVILDIRKGSSTYGKYLSFELREDDPKALYVPIGCAHGFKSLENDSIVSYIQTSVYNKDCDTGIRYNSFDMNWGKENHIISERDLSFRTLSNFKTPFL